MTPADGRAATTESVHDRVAFVTGASGGIGSACAVALAAAGHRIAVAYGASVDGADKTVAAIEEAGGSALSVQCDVTDAAAVDEAFSSVEKAWGPTEILVNAAGANRDKLLVQLDDDDWAHTLATDLTGPFHTTRRAMRPMIRARWGRVVQVASVVGAMGSPGQSNYAAAKAGLVGFSRSVAREVAKRNITINVVEPGPIDTAMTAALPESRQAFLRETTPAARFGTPEEVAAVVNFLASDAASYVTGAVVPVDGGLAMGR